MPYIPKDRIAAAREMDLLTYLRRFEPEALVHIGGNTYATRTHDSLKISNGKWCWWSRSIGGTNALDYLTKVEGVPFLDAVQRILREPPHVLSKSEPTAPFPKTEFTLPPKHADTRRVFSYLRSRGIDAEIINHTEEMFLKRNALLQGEIKELQSGIEELEEICHNKSEYRQAQEIFLPTTAHILDYYDRMTPEEKNRLWKLLMEKITYYRNPEKPDSIEIHLYPRLGRLISIS